MNKDRLHNKVILTLLIIWLVQIFPFLKQILGLGPRIYPVKTLSSLEKTLFLSVTFLFVTSLLVKAYGVLSSQRIEVKTRKMIPFVLLLLFVVPNAIGYVFDQDIHFIGQTIINLGDAVMEEDFDDTPPGEDPPGWEEGSGDWFTVDDGGNNVYYQNDDGDREALSISTTGNTSWTDYSFLARLKFDTGPSNKPDRGALLVIRYTGGNNYYFLAMREARDELEVFKHGTGGGGHLRGTASCALVPDTWYSVNITIVGGRVWVSVDDTYYFSDLDMGGSHSQGSVGIGTEYYKVMFDDIRVELVE